MGVLFCMAPWLASEMGASLGTPGCSRHSLDFLCSPLMSTSQQPLGRHLPKTQNGPGFLRLCPPSPRPPAPALLVRPQQEGGGWEPCLLLGTPPAPPPPTEPRPTLADAVARGDAAQVESRLAAAVLRPLHLRTARRAAEGGVAGHAAVGGRCGEKTPSVRGPGAPAARPTLGRGREENQDGGAAPSQSSLWSRERKDE